MANVLAGCDGAIYIDAGNQAIGPPEAVRVLLAVCNCSLPNETLNKARTREAVIPAQAEIRLESDLPNSKIFRRAGDGAKKVSVLKSKKETGGISNIDTFTPVTSPSFCLREVARSAG